MIESYAVEDRYFATFEKHDEFVATQSKLLDLCYKTLNREEEDEADQLQRRLGMILDEYQEQAYLLDPFLERLVNPVVQRFKLSVADVSSSKNNQGPNISYIAFLLYSYIKFRGHKTITRFFPHEIDDLSIALEFLLHSEADQDADQERWPLRYVMLLWLSLICMLPFDLAQFDEPENLGKTAADLEAVAKRYLTKAGIEREGAAMLLSRLYARQDTNAKFPAFLQWAEGSLQSSDKLFLSIGALQVVCELVKSGSTSHVMPHTAPLLQFATAVEESKPLMSNILVRKFRIKLVSRVILRLLPPRKLSRGKRGKALVSSAEQSVTDDDDEDIDIPDELEDILGNLLTALQDKDTVVRYSAAKALARISERLPADFTDQVLQQVLALYTIHSLGAATLYDMPALAEATWHGASLACAEMARRGLVPDARLAELVGWLHKALFFDIRKGAHSVGASVRDAAAYVLWSLARAQAVHALAPHALSLARTLVTAAVFDREVHIRRAASAAFQEFVGRTSLFPEGISVLRTTDFYAVGTRRNAFLVAAPDVASYDAYRDALVQHLLNVTLRHWDPALRRLGAQALSTICAADLEALGPPCVKQAARLVDAPDAGDVHGALCALAELAGAWGAAGSEEHLREIFAQLTRLSPALVLSSRNELVTAAACTLIARSISREDASAPGGWRAILDYALKSPSVPVQEAAADALGSLSRLVEYAPRGLPAVQQNAARALGALDYSAHEHGLRAAVLFLVSTATRFPNIEARRNAYTALPHVLSAVLAGSFAPPSPELAASVMDALLHGLEDYTTDARGDVGSWVRAACVRGLADALALLQATALVPAEMLHRAVGGVLKQGAERLDGVRVAAGAALRRILVLPENGEWSVYGRQRMRELLLSDDLDWADAPSLFPRLVQLLAIHPYRASLLSGLVLAASSRTDSTQRAVAAALVAYAEGLDAEDLSALVRDVLAPAIAKPTANSAVVPALHTLGLLLDADALTPLYDTPEGTQTLTDLLALCTKGAERWKTLPRLAASSRVVAGLLATPLRAAAAKRLPLFLAHAYPKVRAETAERVYVVLQSAEEEAEEAETVLLETVWTEDEGVREKAERCAVLLAGGA